MARRGRAVSRRDFLQGGLAAAATLLLSGQAPGPRRGVRVVVVGAGLSGLTCAYELHHGGFDVQVVEARARLGGRVDTGTLAGGLNVEHGGELIGLQHVAWAAYAQRFGLKFAPVPDFGEGPALVDGVRLGADDRRHLEEELAIACRRLEADAASVDAERPWLHPKAALWDQRSLLTHLQSMPLQPRTLRFLANALETDNGVAAEAQSLLAVLAMLKGGGLEHFWSDSSGLRCQGGNAQLAACLAAGLGPHRVHLGRPVTRIGQTAGAASRWVAAADGAVYEADAVVLAVPPSVWGGIRIEPALPAGLAPQMGSAVKYLLGLEGPITAGPAISRSDGLISYTWPAEDPRALVCFTGGAAAVRAQAVEASQRDPAYDRALQAVFPQYTAARATARRFVNWSQEPFTRGGYSFPAPGQVTTLGPQLHRDHAGLHLAGEHVWYPFIGFMEGALQSGAAVARRIAQAMG